MKFNISEARPINSKVGTMIRFTFSILDDEELPLVSIKGMLYMNDRKVLPTRLSRSIPLVELRADVLKALESRLAGIKEIQQALGTVPQDRAVQFLGVNETYET